LHTGITVSTLSRSRRRPLVTRQTFPPVHECPTFASPSHLDARALVETLVWCWWTVDQRHFLCEASGRDFGSIPQPPDIYRGLSYLTQRLFQCNCANHLLHWKVPSLDMDVRRVSSSKVRRRLGFSSSGASHAGKRKRWLRRSIVTGSSTPFLV
jgi:hypothetical protein